MRGMYFVEIIDDRVTSEGRIEGLVEAPYWRVAFYSPGVPPVSRLVSVERMVHFHLFNSLEDLRAWMAPRIAPSKPTENPTAEPDIPIGEPENPATVGFYEGVPGSQDDGGECAPYDEG